MTASKPRPGKPYDPARSRRKLAMAQLAVGLILVMNFALFVMFGKWYNIVATLALTGGIAYLGHVRRAIGRLWRES